jgi:hypothetical protein
MRILASLIVTLAVAAGLATSAQAHTPILFVHGWKETGSL